METTREGRSRDPNSRWLSGAWALVAALCVLALVTPIVGHAAPAAEAPGPNGPGDDFERTPERRLLSRHRIESLRMTRGPKGGYGSFLMTGRIDVREGGDDSKKDEDVRKIARRFLRQHGDLLDVADADQDLQEVRLLRLHGLPGQATISFRRNLDGLPVEGSFVGINFDADGVISSVDGDFVPLTPELIEAVRARKNKRHVDKAEVIAIVTTDLQREEAPPGRVSIGVAEPEEVIVTEPPYVVWKTSGSAFRHYEYRIDASTGAIVKKEYVSVR